jgi:hypothetical protein|tara:strand:- start:613 stop:723 length:111 start_codon:yes stop_codon:yes gene_type:complete
MRKIGKREKKKMKGNGIDFGKSFHFKKKREHVTITL